MVFESLSSVFIKANSEDPDEMLHNAAFHEGCPCLSKHHFIGRLKRLIMLHHFTAKAKPGKLNMLAVVVVFL